MLLRRGGDKAGTALLRLAGGGWNPVVSRCSTTGYRPAPLPGCELGGVWFPAVSLVPSSIAWGVFSRPVGTRGYTIAASLGLRFASSLGWWSWGPLGRKGGVWGDEGIWSWRRLWLGLGDCFEGDPG
jgi:hypothetical protein